MTTPSNVPQAGFGSSPPGGMGVTAQGFGQEGYVLDRIQPKERPGEAEENFSVGVPLCDIRTICPSVRRTGTPGRSSYLVP